MLIFTERLNPILISACRKAYQEIYDSVFHSIYKRSAAKFREESESELRQTIIKIPDDIVLSNAVANVKEAVPLLKAALSSARSPYNKDVVELALAVFGDSIYQQIIFNKHRQYVKKSEWSVNEFNKDINAMFVINTQESIGLLVDWLDTTRKFKMYAEDDHPQEYYFASYAVPHLLKLILDKPTQEKFMKLPASWNGPKSRFILFEEISIDQILFVKQWMIANKGKYKIG